MKRIFSVLTIIFLLSCYSQSGALEEVPAATITSTVTTVPTATKEMSVVEQLLTAYLVGGSIEVSKLSEDERVELSAKLAKKKNAERDINFQVR